MSKPFYAIYEEAISYQHRHKPKPKIGEAWLQVAYHWEPSGRLYTVADIKESCAVFHVWELGEYMAKQTVPLHHAQGYFKKADQQGLPKSQRAKVAPKPGEVWQMLGNIGKHSDRIYTILAEATPGIIKYRETLRYVNSGKMIYLETLDPKRGLRGTGMTLDFFYRYMQKI